MNVFDKDDPALLKTADDPFVVNDGMAYVKGCTVNLECQFDHFDGKGDSGTESTRCC